MTTSLFRDLDMKLNCFVLGDQRSQVFQVEIPKTRAVISLKRAIKEKRLTLMFSSSTKFPFLKQTSKQSWEPF
jgi:hypothetical protein